MKKKKVVGGGFRPKNSPKMKNSKRIKHSVTALHQMCNIIPPHPGASLAHRFGVDRQSRRFTPWSHVVALLFAQITHSIGLNDVCDALRHHTA